MFFKRMRTHFAILLVVSMMLSAVQAAAAAPAEPGVLLAAAGGPVIQSTYPGDNDPMVPSNAIFTVRFDENIQRNTTSGSTAAVRIYRRSDNVQVAAYLASDTAHLNISGSTLTIIPQAGTLVPAQDYYILIDQGVVYSASGPFAGISDATVWNFSVVAADSTAPTLDSMSPAPGSTNADPLGSLVLTFSESVTPAAGNLRLVRNDGSNDVQTISVLSSSVTGAGTSVITVKPAVRLVSGKNYYVLIDPGAFVDAAGNKFAGIGSPSAWTFTTAPSMVAAPALDPPAGSIHVGAAAPVIRMQFSAPVTAGIGNIYIKRMTDNIVVQTVSITDTANTPDSPQYVNISGGTVLIFLAPLAYNTDYYVMVDPGAIRQGPYEYEGITDASTWFFKTELSSSASNPKIVTLTPADNGVLTSVTGKLSIKFNEPVYPDSGSITIRNANGSLFCSIPVTSASVTGGGTDTITITPCASFVNGSSYSVHIGGLSFRNAANKYFAGFAAGDTTSWNFTVTQDQSAPDLVSMTPAPGSTGIRTSGLVLSAVFNEPVKVHGAAVELMPYKTTSPAPILADLSVDPADPKKVNLRPRTALKGNTDYSVRIPNNAISDLAGNYYQGILNDFRWTFKTLASSTAAPRYVSGSISGNSIILTYDQELDPNSVPLPASYYVTVNGTARSVVSVKVSDNQVTLTLASGVLEGQAVKVHYTSGALRNLNGKYAANLNGVEIKGASDQVLPQLTGGTASGYIVTLFYNKTLASFTNPASALTQFSVKVNGTTIYPGSVYTSGSSLVLMLPVQLLATDIVSVTYKPSTDTIRDQVGNPAAAFTDYYVMNGADKTPPAFTHGVASANKVTLYYNEGLMSSIVPPASSFAVVNGNTPAAVTAVKITGNAVELTLSRNITSGTPVTVTYIPGAPPIMDLSGNPAAAFAGVQMNAGGTTGQVLSASLEGTLLTINFNTALNTSSVPQIYQFYVKSNGAYVPVTGVSISGSSVVLTLSSSINAGNTVTVSYFGTGNVLKDINGQAISAFTDYPVTNGTSSVGPLPSFLEAESGGGLKLKSPAFTTAWGQTASGRPVTRYTVDADMLISAFTQLKSVSDKVGKPDIVISVPSTENAAIVNVPVRSLIDAQTRISNAVFRVDYGDVQFHLPVTAIKLAQETQQLGGNTYTASLELAIEKLASVPAMTSAIYTQGYTLLASPTDFTVTLKTGAQQKELKDFEFYVKRTFILTGSLAQNPKEIAVVRYDDALKQLSYVPTAIEPLTDGVAVHFKRKGNSVYAVVRKKPTPFSDMANHWAKDDVAFLASKFIADGRSAAVYDPDRAITRAEFAKLIVKGLGLSVDSAEAAKFRDVGTVSLDSGYIGAASKAGIVAGHPDGTFRPNDTITRQDMAAMMQRAMTYAGVQVSSSTSVLSRFGDRSRISSYAESAVAACVEAGILSGMTPSRFSPLENATRAQAASMIKRFLEFVEFLPK